MKETVLSMRDYSVPSKLTAVLKELVGAVQKIPENLRGTAAFELKRVYEYSECEVEMEITYYRPETDEELAARQAAEDDKVRRQEAYERAALKALQAKYGEPK